MSILTLVRFIWRSKDLASKLFGKRRLRKYSMKPQAHNKPTRVDTQDLISILSVLVEVHGLSHNSWGRAPTTIHIVLDNQTDK